MINSFYIIKYLELEAEYTKQTEKMIILQKDSWQTETRLKEELNKKERDLHEKQVAINSLKEELKYKEELLRQQQQYLGRQNNTVKTPHSPHSKEILLK